MSAVEFGGFIPEGSFEDQMVSFTPSVVFASRRQPLRQRGCPFLFFRGPYAFRMPCSKRRDPYLLGGKISLVEVLAFIEPLSVYRGIAELATSWISFSAI